MNDKINQDYIKCISLYINLYKLNNQQLLIFKQSTRSINPLFLIKTKNQNLIEFHKMYFIFVVWIIALLSDSIDVQ